MPGLDRVSVLVVSWNGREHLEECLQSLEEQRCGGVECEVWVFDNGSTDGTEAYVRRRHPDVRLLSSPVNVGFAAANNRLAEHAAGDALVLVNNDMRAEPEWLEALVDLYRTAPDDVAGVAGRIVDWEGDRLDFGRGILTFDGHAFALHQGRPLGLADLPSSGEEALFACGGNMLVDRRTFLESGGFAERYFAYFEDVELGWRLWSEGKRLLYCAEGATRHRSSATSSRLGNRRRGAMFERNALWTMLRNLVPPLRSKLLPAVLLTFLSRLDALIEGDDVDGLLAAPLPEDPAPSFGARLARLLERRRSRRAGLEDPLVVRSDGALAHLEALRAVCTAMDEVAFESGELAARRRRSDEEIFERFPLWIVPTYPGDARLFASPLFESLLPSELRFERAALTEVLVAPVGPAEPDETS